MNTQSYPDFTHLAEMSALFTPDARAFWEAIQMQYLFGGMS